MRKIKFRAWNYLERKWWDNFAIYDNAVHGTYMGEIQYDSNAPLQVSQYTGLHDKNGVEIYEGDIVRAGFDGSLTGTIVFGMYKPVMNSDEWEGHQSFYINWHDWNGMTRGELGYWLQKNMDTQAYVIGNIYENPELDKS